MTVAQYEAVWGYGTRRLATIPMMIARIVVTAQSRGRESFSLCICCIIQNLMVRFNEWAVSEKRFSESWI